MKNAEFYADGVLKELKRLNSNFEKLTEVLIKKFDRTGVTHLTEEEQDALLNALCQPEEEWEYNEREVQTADPGDLREERPGRDDQDRDVGKED